MQYPIIDFDLIFNEQLKGINYVESEGLDKKCRIEGVKRLMDYRTVSIGGPRQTGKTCWVISKLEELNGIIVVKNSNMKKLHVSNYENVDPTRIITVDDLLRSNMERFRDTYKKYKPNFTFVDDCIHYPSLNGIYVELNREVELNHIVVLVN